MNITVKRAAVKFGVARELYKKDEEVHHSRPQSQGNGGGQREFAAPTKPADPTIGDPMSEAQRGKIKTECNHLKIDPVGECQAELGCHPSRLSKKGASYFINYLMEKGKITPAPNQQSFQNTTTHEAGKNDTPIPWDEPKAAYETKIMDEDSF